MLSLYNHTVYSYKNAISKVQDVANISKEQGHNHFVVTDMNNMTAFSAAFDIQHSTGMTFIPGVEYFVKPIDMFNELQIEQDLTFIKKEYNLARTTDEMRESFDRTRILLQNRPRVKYNTVILLSKDEIGMNNLIDFNNHQIPFIDESDYYMPRKDLVNFSESLFAIIGHENSELHFLISNNLDEHIPESINAYIEAYGENLFISISEQNERSVNIKLYNLAKEYGVKLVYAPLSKYPTRNEKKDSRLFYAIFADALNEEVTNLDLHIHTEEDLNAFSVNYIEDLPNEVLVEIYKNIEYIVSHIKQQEFPTAPPLHGGHDELRERCEEGLIKRFPVDGPERAAARERMNYELEVIKDKNFSQYFIKVMAISDTAKKHGILLGPGRGSAGGCMVTYLVGITEINPLEYGLLFERFINPSRPSYPDVDQDFANTPLSEKLNRKFNPNQSKLDKPGV